MSLNMNSIIVSNVQPFDEIGEIIRYEQGELDAADTLRLYSHLVKTGAVWHLQGRYGRTASNLIAGGYLDRAGTILKDADDE
jgi:hypothetical protein